jgi:hypothetical protein
MRRRAKGFDYMQEWHVYYISRVNRRGNGFLENIV